MIQLIFITMISLLYYSAGMKDFELFAATFLVGVGLMSLIVIERELRAAGWPKSPPRS